MSSLPAESAVPLDPTAPSRTAVPSDPAAPVADLLAAKEAVLAFAANATVIRRSDPMLGTLLDERA